MYCHNVHSIYVNSFFSQTAKLTKYHFFLFLAKPFTIHAANDIRGYDYSRP